MEAGGKMVVGEGRTVVVKVSMWVSSAIATEVGGSAISLDSELESAVGLESESESSTPARDARSVSSGRSAMKALVEAMQAMV